MNNINVSTSSKKVLLTTIVLLLIGAPLLVYVVQQQQIFKQFAWATKQSAEAVCDEDGAVSLTVSFTNDEATKDMDVVAKDLQTGTSVDLGTVVHQQTGTGTIATGAKSLEKGAVLFTLTWTDGTTGTDTRSAAYTAKADCQKPPAYCPTAPDEKGYCKWDKLEDVEDYTVEVIDVESGDTVKTETVDGNETQLAFDMAPGKAYQCKVTTKNACGTGKEVKSPEKTCTPLTPTPTETPKVCPDEPVKEGICRWDVLEGANEYKVIIKDKETGETISEKTVKAPDHELVYPANPGKTYTCTVVGVGECSESKPIESEPVTCPSLSPTPTPTVQPSGTPVPPTGTPVPPTPTPTPVPPTPTTIIITATPQPTPTPVVIVRLPQQPRIVQPPVVQQPGQPQTVVQQPPAVVQQQAAPPVVVQQPAAPQQVTPAPTIPPTGAVSDSLILVGSSVLLLLVGGLLFFAI